jgi:hypothetical protein
VTSEAEADTEPAWTSYPAWYVRGADRKRIAIEEGSRARYWIEARKNLGWAWTCLICTSSGGALLLWILWIQAASVWRAAFP